MSDIERERARAHAALAAVSHRACPPPHRDCLAKIIDMAPCTVGEAVDELWPSASPQAQNKALRR